MNENKVCPNCGAKIDSLKNKCEYCGYELPYKDENMSQYTPQVRARKYRQSALYKEANEAYGVWILADSMNDAVWFEYMEFLFEYSQALSFYNLRQTIAAYIAILEFCLRTKRFKQFKDQAKAVQLVGNIIHSTKQVEVDMVFQKGNPFINLQELLTGISGFIQEQNQERYPVNIFALEYMQLLFTTLLDENNTQDCLAYSFDLGEVPADVTAKRNKFILLKDLFQHKLTEIKGVVEVEEGGLKVASLVLVIITIAVTGIFLLSGIMNTLAYGYGVGVAMIIGSVLVIGGTILEFCLKKTYSPLKYIARVVVALSTFCTLFITLIPFAILMLIDALMLHKIKSKKVAKAAEFNRIIEQYNAGIMTRGDVLEQVV